MLPEMESVVEGTIIEWYKQPGDAVEQNEDLCEISTDKVDTPVPSPVAGVLREIVVPEGETFQITDPICYLAVGAGVAAPALPAAPAAAPSGDGAAPAPGHPAVAVGGPPATPLARRLAAASGVDLAGVTGSGPAGMITKRDVAAAPAGTGNGAAPKAAPAAPAAGAEEGQLLKGPNAVLAQYMDESLKVPTATSFRTLSVATLECPAPPDQRRSRHRRAQREALVHPPDRLGDLVAAPRPRSCAPASSARDGKPQRGEARSQPRPGRRRGAQGRLAHADGAGDQGRRLLGFDGFRQAYEDLVEARAHRGISADEQSGATFTLTNPGGIGTIASVPRLMVGQGTIVATGSIAYPPGLGTCRPTLRRLGDREGHDDDLDLRSPHHPRCGVRRVPASGSTSCSTAPTASTRRFASRSAWPGRRGARPRRQRRAGAQPRAAGAHRRHARARPDAVGGDAARRRRGDVGRHGGPQSRSPGGARSIRSVTSRPATRRSTRERTA